MRIAIGALLMAVSMTAAAEPPKIERKIGKEPTYTGKPSYALLVFDAEGKDRVWLVRDGDTLYVDKNGNGDLTEPAEKITRKPPGKKHRLEAKFHTFEVGDITVNGRTHKDLKVEGISLSLYLEENQKPTAGIKKLLKEDPDAVSFMIECNVACPTLKSDAPGGLLNVSSDAGDPTGPLLLAKTPSEAPVINFGGPFSITFLDRLPVLQIGKNNEAQVVVVTNGLGNGARTVLGYDDTIPSKAYPKLEITFPPAKEGDPPVKELFELKKRC